MEKSLRVTTLFLTGIILSALCSSSMVLDFTLTPRFVILAVFILLALAVLSGTGFRPAVKPDVLLLSYALYVVFCCFSISWSTTPSEAWFESAKVVLGFFTFLFTYFSMKRHETYFTNGLLKFSIAVVFIGCFVAFIQYSDKATFTKASLYVITSLNGHKNLYASFLFLNSFFLIRGVLTSAGGLRIFSAAALILTLIMIIFLRTKAVWIGSALTLLIFTTIPRVKNMNFRLNVYFVLTIFLLLANLFFIYLLPLIVHAVLHSGDPETTATPMALAAQTFDSERLALWEKTYDMIGKHPVAGVGMGNWQIYFPDATLSGVWRAEDLNYTFQRPHNDFLWVLAETGLIGLNLMLLFLLGILLFLLRSFRALAVSKESILETALCLAFMPGFFIISFFDFPKERIEHIVWINIVLGTSYYLIRKNAALPVMPGIRLRGIAYAVSCALLGFITYIGMLRYKGELYTRKMYNYRSSKEESQAVMQGYEALSFAYSIDPTSVPVQWYTANSYANMGNFKAAQVEFIAALKYNPYNRNVLNDLASSYASVGSDELALKYYAEAARISPRFDDPKLNAAAVYIREKKFEKADSSLHQLLHDSERRKSLQTMVDAFK